MEQKKIGFFTKVKNSITSPASYAEFLKESMGKAVLYLLLLCIILGGIAAIKDIIVYEKAINSISYDLKDKVPDFTFKNGELNVTGKMPIILDGNKDNPLIIDTDQGADASLLNNYSNATLITKTKLYQKQSSSSIRETSLESFKTLNLTKDNLANMLNVIRFLIFLIIIIEPLFFFGFKFIAAFIVAIMGLLINIILKSELSFKELYKLSIYALTLSLILKVLYQLLPFSTGFFSIIYYVVGGVYLALALKHIKSINKTDQTI